MARKPKLRTLVLLAAALLPLAGRAQAAEKLPKVVVLSIKPVDEATAQTAATLTELLTTELASTRRFEVMGESEVGSMVGFERQKQILGCSNDTSCLAEIGGALGCEFLLLGTMGRVGSQLRLDLKLADVRKTRIAGRGGVTVATADELIEGGRRALQAVLDSVSGTAPAATAPVPAAPAPKVQEPEGPGSAPYVLMGVGGAALLAGGALAGATLATRADRTYDSNARRLTAGLAVGGVGLAALLAGVAWNAAADDPEPSTALTVAPIHRGAAVIAVGSF